MLKKGRVRRIHTFKGSTTGEATLIPICNRMTKVTNRDGSREYILADFTDEGEKKRGKRRRESISYVMKGTFPTTTYRKLRQDLWNAYMQKREHVGIFIRRKNEKRHKPYGKAVWKGGS